MSFGCFWPSNTNPFRFVSLWSVLFCSVLLESLCLACSVSHVQEFSSSFPSSLPHNTFNSVIGTKGDPIQEQDPDRCSGQVEIVKP